jgi:cytoskeletal protein RodZ
MTDSAWPSSSPPYPRADGQHSPVAPRESWFRSRAGRRFGWEIALLVVLKLILLAVLWFGFIKPWLRPAAPPATVVQQFYTPASLPASPHHD